MSRRIQAVVAALIFLISLIALGAAAYLIFFFPRTLELWADQGRAMTGSEQLLADTSDVLKRSGLIILPLQMFISGASCVWLIFALAASRRDHDRA